ncbi:HotDog domain-containing protein [Xylaria cf. heliscus]|nr:HotDog domain-containing protein [Xylaria cf. heliscus]
MSSFDSIPWCGALLQKPGVVRFTPQSRMPAGPDGRFPSPDQLFKTSLKTADTVPEYIGFYQSPFSDPIRMTLPPIESMEGGPRFLINTMSLLIDLRPGVNGANGTAHGGLIASLLDEAMGCLLFGNAMVQREMMTKGATIPPNILNLADAGPTLTATMNVKFMRPIATPQVVIARATLTKSEGRKLVLSYDIKDSKGAECARGEGIWVTTFKEKL